ncbi:MAG: hypothetical protein IPJ77_13405 [Planctomycetes bacterium]|nr:hypothetical protein [Planctomycetota bacterium]
MQPRVSFLSLVLAATALVPVARAQAPNPFFQRGTPTFVRGTAGEERTDKVLAAQVELIRSMAFPTALVVDDKSIDVTKGASAWPPNPVLYGSNEHNAVLAALGNRLPFRFVRGGLEIGARSFSGGDVRLIACIPAEKDEGNLKGWPEFLVYAGVGPMDAQEINSVRHGDLNLLVIDRFGPLVGGSWKRDAKGKLDVVYGPVARREAWRNSNAVDRANPRPVFVHHVQLVPAAPKDEEEVSAVLRAVERAASRLLLERFDAVHVYVHPDRKSKEILTANGGDGHTDPASRTVHVIAFDAAEGGPLENLVTHEVVHALTVDAVGPMASSFLGEGLAVWASGVYQEKPLGEWKRELAGKAPAVAEMFTLFRKLPENVAYPLAGLFVDLCVREVGWDAFKQSLAGASASSWAAACKSAGTSAEAIDGAWAKALAKK